MKKNPIERKYPADEKLLSIIWRLIKRGIVQPVPINRKVVALVEFNDGRMKLITKLKGVGDGRN